MEAEYVARKSVLPAFSFLRILLFWLIIPTILIIVDIIKLKRVRIEFYKDKIIQKSGVLSTNEKQTVFMGVTGVSVSKTLFGRMFGYGDVVVDAVGKWDVETSAIKYPEKLKAYLETRFMGNSQVITAM